MIDQTTGKPIDGSPLGLLLTEQARLRGDAPAFTIGAVTTSFAEGMAVLAREEPAMVIADYRLGDGDGLTLLEHVRRKNPRIRCFLHTGEALSRTSLGLDFTVLAKPCSVPALDAVVKGISA